MFSQNLIQMLLDLQSFLDFNADVDKIEKILNQTQHSVIIYGMLLLGLLLIGMVTSRLYPKITAIGGFALVVIGLFKISPLLAVILAGCGILVIVIIFVNKFDNVEEKTNTTLSQTNTNTSSKPAEAFVKGTILSAATEEPVISKCSKIIKEVADHLPENRKVETPSILSAALAERASNPIDKEENTNEEVNWQKP
jgi:hypothetical protein